MNGRRGRRRMTALGALLLPILLAATCNTEPEPYEGRFADERLVLRGDWGGTLGEGEERVGVRLEGLDATLEGVDEYRFEGEIRFGADRIAAISGTGRVEGRFVDAGGDALLQPALSPPPPPHFEFSGTVEEGGSPSWQLQGERLSFEEAYWGEAEELATGSSDPLHLRRLGEQPHVIGFEARPDVVALGEPVTFVWSARVPDAMGITCTLGSDDGQEHELSECASSSSFEHVYRDTGTRNYPHTHVPRLIVRWGDGQRLELQTSVTVVP